MGTDTDPPPLTFRVLFGRAVRLRCPVCGGGGVFRRWVVMADECPTCGFRFERIEGHWIGALGMNTIFTLLIGMIVLIGGFVLMYPNPSVPVLLVSTVSVAILGPLVLFPLTRMVWSASDLMMRPLDPDDGVDPQFWPSGGPPG